MNLKDIKIETIKHFRAIIYGPSGAGKTHLVGTFPAPIYYFDWDHKVRPLLGKDVECDSYNVTKETAVSEVERFDATLRKVLAEEKWKTVVIDSLSTLDPAFLRFLIARSGRNIEYPDIGIYGHHGDKWGWLAAQLNAVQKFPKNVILIGHDQQHKNAADGVWRICPLMAGDKIQGKLPGYFEETYYYVPKEVGGKTVRRLYYKSVSNCVASSSVLTGPGYIDDPTYDKIITEMQRSVVERNGGKMESQ